MKKLNLYLYNALLFLDFSILSINKYESNLIASMLTCIILQISHLYGYNWKSTEHKILKKDKYTIYKI